MLGKYNFFVCRECGKKKPGNYFISKTLCKKCAAKRRAVEPNPVVEVGESILATTIVLKRLRRQAESQIPFTWRDWLARFALFIFLAVFWYVGFPFGNPTHDRTSNPNFSVRWILTMFWLFWYTLFPALFGLWFSIQLSKPREKSVLVYVQWNLPIRERKNWKKPSVFMRVRNGRLYISPLSSNKVTNAENVAP